MDTSTDSELAQSLHMKAVESVKSIQHKKDHREGQLDREGRRGFDTASSKYQQYTKEEDALCHKQNLMQVCGQGGNECNPHPHYHNFAGMTQVRDHSG